MRAINPEAYIVGEIWHVSTEYLSGERFDALMNYVFTEAALAFTGRERIVKKLQDDRGYNPWPAIDGNEYADKIDALLGVYDWNVQQAQMNLLDSHDTARAITLAGDDVRTLELATLLLFTYPGAPTVYYGDEIGLDGGLPDKWARKTFPWDDETRWNTQLREHYQGLIKLRNELPALRQGSYQGLASTPQSYAFERHLGDVSAVVALNTSDLPDRLVLGQSGKLDLQVAVGNMAEVEATEDGMAISLPARSGGIWVVTHG
jgi:glycosidase